VLWYTHLARSQARDFAEILPQNRGVVGWIPAADLLSTTKRLNLLALSSVVLRLLVHLITPDNQLELAKNATNTGRGWKTASALSHRYCSARGTLCDVYYPNALRK